MNERVATRLSKFLSYALRHRPFEAGIELDGGGWAEVSAVLRAASRNGREVSLEDLEYIVASNNKKRFAFNDDHSRIRASQGHSVRIELGYVATEPLELLHHGTVARFVESIRTQGLLKGERHHVHLSADEATARKVGQRRGEPVLLVIRAAAMHRDGLVFYRSENGVWLTDAVPATYIMFP